MNAISVFQRVAENDPIVVHDVDKCIRSWGKRGMALGSLGGVGLGAIVVAYPFTEDVLTFGAIGTLVICSLECAAVTGALGALTAALGGQGTPRDNSSGWVRPRTGRTSAEANRAISHQTGTLSAREIGSLNLRS